MMFDIRMKPPRIIHHIPATTTSIPSYRSGAPIPFVNDGESRSWLIKHGAPVYDVDATSHANQSLSLELPGDASDPHFSFRQVQSQLMQADVVFGNLECPLSLRGRSVRNDCCYAASPEIARALAAANFRVVSFSNNHSMDFGEVAFIDTIEALESNGVRAVGAGRDYQNAREPAVLEIRGTRLAFLAYNLVGPEMVYSTNHEAGVVPLNDMVLSHDIERLRGNVDCIIASAHWGTEGKPLPLPSLVALAHRMIDCGVDIIFGHHPHVPGSIEIYRSKPIFYSLGNFIFGHTHRYWTDNMMVRLTIAHNRTEKIEIIPIGSKGVEQYQPLALRGNRAAELIGFVNRFSGPFGVAAAIDGDIGLILPEMICQPVVAEGIAGTIGMAGIL
jgi:poly-gamma-glutamate capsule biosynthesis protein CapA/YwtB (metallophosphatase superfamily)